MQPKNIKTCEVCGFELVEIGKAPFVIVQPCRKCESERNWKEHIPILESGDFANIPLRFKAALLKDFDNKYSFQDGSYFITGVCGTGKTHLAVALMKDYCIKNRKSRDTKFYNFQDIAISVKCSFAQGAEGMDTIIDKCQETKFAIFDDICTTKPTATEIDALYLIVNYKYENYLPAIYTSNLSIREISTIYGDRIASRLSACTQIKLTGEDRRLTKR